MTAFQILPVIAFAATAIFVLTRKGHDTRPGPAAWRIPAAICALFSLWTIHALVAEGPVAVWQAHSTSVWGNQVWFDLLLATAIAFAGLARSARRAGIALLPWALLVVATASIGLLALLARLLFLEARRPA